MKGPAFITTDGRRLPLEWTRLKPSSEVNAAIPEPGEPDVSVMRAIGEWDPVADTDPVGDGFDRRRFRVRALRPAKPAPRLIIGGEVFRPKPGFVVPHCDESDADDGPLANVLLPDLGRDLSDGEADSFKGAREAIDRNEPSLPNSGYISLPLDRPWLGSEVDRFEKAALAILAAHDFPVRRDFPVWRVVGEELAWTVLPAEQGAVEGEGRTFAFADGGSVLLDHGPYAARWPAGSAFRWAQTVYRLLMPVRDIHRSILALGLPDAVRSALETAFTSAFELGSAMTENSFRRLYDADLREGQQASRVRRQGGQTTAAKRKAKADTVWRTEALILATALRKKHPTWGQKRIAHSVVGAPGGQTGIAGAPAIDTVVAQIRTWEKTGELPLSARRRDATPPS